MAVHGKAEHGERERAQTHTHTYGENKLSVFSTCAVSFLEVHSHRKLKCAKPKIHMERERSLLTINK